MLRDYQEVMPMRCRSKRNGMPVNWDDHAIYLEFAVDSVWCGMEYYEDKMVAPWTKADEYSGRF